MNRVGLGASHTLSRCELYSYVQRVNSLESCYHHVVFTFRTGRNGGGLETTYIQMVLTHFVLSGLWSRFTGQHSHWNDSHK